MRLSHILFALSVAMLVILGITLFLPSHPSATGVPDKRVFVSTTVGSLASPMGNGPLVTTAQLFPGKEEAMFLGGSGQERHADLFWFGWAFATVIMVFFTCLISLASQRKGEANRFSRLVLLGNILLIAVVALLFYCYREFLKPIDSAADVSFLGPFPTATTVAIVGVWSGPLFFVLLYFFLFPKYIWTKEDEAKYQQVIA